MKPLMNMEELFALDTLSRLLYLGALPTHDKDYILNRMTDDQLQQLIDECDYETCKLDCKLCELEKEDKRTDADLTDYNAFTD